MSSDCTPEQEKQRERHLEAAKALPNAPGVYLFKDAQEQVLYVGKAKSLCDRVRSYFLPSTDLGPRKGAMLELIASIDTVPADSEAEAVFMESRLIKDLKPKYNVLSTDDRTFPYLAVTVRDEFPGVFVTRTPQDKQFKSATIYGPFVSSGALREAVRVMQRIFKFRTCHLDIKTGDPNNRSFRPCLLHAIDQCSAPCADHIAVADYKADIKRLQRFIGSQRSQVMKELQQHMDEASAAQDYERAACFRDQLHSIEKLDERERTAEPGQDWQPEVTVFATDPASSMRSLNRVFGADVAIRSMEAIDIAHLGGTGTVGAKVCFIDGRPCKTAYRRYRIRTAGNDDFQSMREVVARGYAEAGKGQALFPDLILIDGGQGQLGAALEAFARMAHQPPLVVALAKKEEVLWVQDATAPLRLGRTNPALKLCQAIRDEAHRFAGHYHEVLRRKRLLDPAEAPDEGHSPGDGEVSAGVEPQGD
ncbi:MAG: UvrB/UvrC motif-containing protein [Phycisphaerales bacterium]|nr:UvrB/UvrC motif-containing protein [Phycisphaerales bacterium]